MADRVDAERARCMHLFFDLDGTLTDSAPGIVGCLNHALAELRVPCAPEDRLRAMIGTPLQTIFERLLNSTDEGLLRRAVVSYRDRFDRAGIFENSVFPGIEEALGEFRRQDHRLQVVTAKPAVVARRVLEHLAIADFFEAVHGPGLDDERCDKADYVEAALRLAEGRHEQAVMIGDRVDDVLAARAHGVRAVGVGWGYGSREELIAAEPVCVVASIAELVAWVQAAAERAD